MALIKNQNYRGFTLNYWIITTLGYNKKDNVTFGILSPYKDQLTREQDIKSDFPELQFAFKFNGNLTSAQCYKLITQSVTNKVLKTPSIPARPGVPAIEAQAAIAAIPAQFDKDNNLLAQEIPAVPAVEARAAIPPTPEVPAVFDDIETNFFVDAKSDV